MSSDIVSLRRRVVKLSNDMGNMPYTILLVGETGFGRSLLIKFISNALLGNYIDHYDLDIINEGPPYVGMELPHLYEVTSNNGVLVSANVLKVV